MSLGVDLLADTVGNLVDLEQGDVGAAGDVDQHTPCPLHRHLIEQRVGDRRLGGRRRPLLAFGFAGPHHRLAHLAHHRPDVREIQVDQPRHHHQVGDPAHARIEHFVRLGKGVGEGGLFVRHPEQVLVGDHDQRIDMLLQFLDTGIGDPRPFVALELKRLGDDPDRKHALLAGEPGDHGSGSGAGSAAHAGGDEHHIRAGHVLGDFVHRFLRRGAPDIGPGTGAEAVGDVVAELNLAVGQRLDQRLGIGVGHQEFDAFQLRIDHVVDGIAAGAADPDHHDLGFERGLGRGNRKIDGHGCLLAPGMLRPRRCGRACLFRLCPRWGSKWFTVRCFLSAIGPAGPAGRSVRRCRGSRYRPRRGAGRRTGAVPPRSRRPAR